MSENKGIYAQFTLEPIEMAFKSQQEGRPIYEDREFVRIIIAGDKNSEVYREVTDNDRERFDEVYARFKRGLSVDEQIIGTPLKAWSILKPSQVKEFEALEIRTVEALAGLSDTQKQNLGMGAHEIVAKAKAYLEAAKDSSFATNLAAENEQLKADVADLKSQIETLAKMIDEDSESRRARTGPRKSERHPDAVLS